MKKLSIILIVVFTIIFFSILYYRWIEYFAYGINHFANIFFKKVDIEKSQDSILNSIPEEYAKKNFLLINQIKEFGADKYNLHNSKSYDQYVDLKRKHLGWILFVAEPYKFESMNFNFLFFGSFSYLGFFNENLVKKWQNYYESKGYDTYISFMGGYNSMGILKDPLFSTQLYSSQTSFIDLILHEMAHERLYLKNDTNLSEQLATYIAQKATKQFIKEKIKKNKVPEKNSIKKVSIKKYLSQIKKERDLFRNIAKKTRKKLDILYAKNIPDDEKYKEKKRLYKQFQENLKKNKDYFQILYQPHNIIKKESINNAYFMMLTFYQGIPSKNSFSLLFENFCKKDYECFFQEMEKMEDCPQSIKDIFTTKEREWAFFLKKCSITN